MAERYFIVRFMVGGYEVSILVFGSEQGVVQTIQKTIKGPIFLISISKSTAFALQNDLGMKVYACLSDDIDETIITQTVIDPVEDDPDFQSNT